LSGLIGSRGEVVSDEPSVIQVGNDSLDSPEEVFIGVDSDEAGGVDEREECTNAHRPILSSCVHGVVSEQGDLTKGSFTPVIVQMYLWVLEESRKGLPMVDIILHSLRDGMTGQQIFDVLIQPPSKALCDWSCELNAVGEELGILEVLSSSLTLNCVKSGDEPHRLAGKKRGLVLIISEFSKSMSVAARLDTVAVFKQTIMGVEGVSRDRSSPQNRASILILPNNKEVLCVMAFLIKGIMIHGVIIISKDQDLPIVGYLWQKIPLRINLSCSVSVVGLYRLAFQLREDNQQACSIGTNMITCEQIPAYSFCYGLEEVCSLLPPTSESRRWDVSALILKISSDSIKRK